MEIPTQYNPNSVEDKWYEYWMKNNYFHSTPNEKEAYTIVIPPPNVTGVLHMGHMLNNTIQDVLIRRARLKGFNACWVPGTDHASIATEAKVVAKLASEGINKEDLSREEFLKHAWEWTDTHGGIILEQLKKLGASCDWERTTFTMDPQLNESVTKVFVDLYKKGDIYRGYRMVNWDPEAKTTLSDEEVVYEEKQGNLYYVNYNIKGENRKITIATTRPETILGDTAICINPNDSRYSDLKGKEVLVPIANRVIPIIEDEYVDMEFGTGCLKITPAHDPNDKELGEKHKLEVIDILNDDGSLNDAGLQYKGKDRFVVRKEIVEELKDLGLLEKVESHMHKVGTSERTKAVIEPKISAQWFLRMEDLVKPALKAVLEDEEIKLHPKHYNNTYRHWLENIRDWNISRQLWWGHQIPAYFYGEGVNDFVVAESIDEAAALASDKLGRSVSVSEIKQDEDALDTWFSSWLWPISVFDGINNPDNEEINYYYPTNDLVTGPDILFFWVARMIFAGYEYRKEPPFKNVYFTGLVRDKQRRKMSKSLGNSPDPINLIEKYGADGVRVGLLLSSAAGNDLMFDEDLCAQGRNFANKIWNSFRLVNSWSIDQDVVISDSAKEAIEWYKSRFNQVLDEINSSFEEYRLSEALMSIYKLIWDDFSSWLLEAVKPDFGAGISPDLYQEVIGLFENNLKILHPFMPFLTEEIWQHISKRSPQEALIVSNYPELGEVNQEILDRMNISKDIISGIRTIRKDKQISFKEELSLSYLKEGGLKFNESIVKKLGNINEIILVGEAVSGSLTYRVKSMELYIPIGEAVDLEAELEKLREELNYTQGFLKSVEKKLSNERFVNNAPEKVIEMERKKQADAQAKIVTLKASIEGLS
ncbi:MAG: valine--tRNA ligase [Flavobacteriaceae bacterium]